MCHLKVFDVLGSRAATLVNEEKSAGDYENPIRWFGLLQAETYFYKVQAGSFSSSTRKLLLLK